MSARYEIIRGIDGFHFELRSGASLPLLTSGARASLALCKGSIASARKEVLSAARLLLYACLCPNDKRRAP